MRLSKWFIRVTVVLGFLAGAITLVNESLKLYSELPTPTPVYHFPTLTPVVIPPTQPGVSVPNLSGIDYGPLIYQDNFDTDTGVWSLGKGSRIQGGAMLLASQTGSTPNWTNTYTDLVFETAFQFINPPSAGWTALSAYVRYSAAPCHGGPNFCADQVAVSSQGVVAAWTIEGRVDGLPIMSGTEASLFYPTGYNKLTVIIKGSEFRIFVNDIFVRSFNDDRNPSGIVTLGVDDTPVAVDYVRLYSLP